MNEAELGAKAFWLLIGAGAFSGAASLWAFRRWSDTAKLRVTANRIIAHLFEFRLFADEPLLVMRAQRDLLIENAKLLRQLAGPSLLLVVPFAILLAGMDAFFAHAPLQIGQPAIVTVQYRPNDGTSLPQTSLIAPAGMHVETPPVRVPIDSQISWRVRPLRDADGQLEIHCEGRVVRKSISYSPGLQWLSASRAGSTLAFLLHPLEWPFSGSAIKSIAVQYPAATVFHLNWLVWFSLASVAGATLAYLRY